MAGLEYLKRAPLVRYGVRFPSFGIYWADGAAKVTEAGSGTMVGPAQIFSADDLEVEEIEEREVVVEEKKKEEEVEVEVEEKETKIAKEPNEVAELKKQIQELQGDLLKVSLARKEPAKETKKVAEQEELSDAQLLGILQEHKDDPVVQLNIIKHVATQIANATRDTTVKEVNEKQWKSNLSGMSNRILSEDAYLAANPNVKSKLGEYAQNLGLGDHPVGELAALAIMRMMEKSEAKVDVKSTEATKTDLKGTDKKAERTRLSGAQDKDVGLTQEQLAFAKKIGVSAKSYARFLPRSK